jgi:hypothetical protein
MILPSSLATSYSLLLKDRLLKHLQILLRHGIPGEIGFDFFPSRFTDYDSKALQTFLEFSSQEFSSSYFSQAGFSPNSHFPVAEILTSFVAPLKISSASSGLTNTPRWYFSTTVFRGPGPDEANTGFRAETAALSTPLAERNFAL